jgi:hypothetical protein
MFISESLEGKKPELVPVQEVFTVSMIAKGGKSRIVPIINRKTI